MIRVSATAMLLLEGTQALGWTDLVHSSTSLLYVHIHKLLKILSCNSLIYNTKIISVVNEVTMLMRAKYTMSLVE